MVLPGFDCRWPDGEVVSPLELETIDESELDEYLVSMKSVTLV
jgi:hypothetical protein